MTREGKAYIKTFSTLFIWSQIGYLQIGCLQFFRVKYSWH